MNKLFFNNKGQSLVGVLVSSVIGLIVIFGVSKGIIYFSDQANRFSHKKDLAEIKTNVLNMLRSPNGWSASVTKAKEAYPNCFPGKSSCPINLWFNPTAPSSQVDYNSEALGLKQWICTTGSTSLPRGAGVMALNGQPVYFNATACSACSSLNSGSFTKCIVENATGREL